MKNSFWPPFLRWLLTLLALFCINLIMSAFVGIHPYLEIHLVIGCLAASLMLAILPQNARSIIRLLCLAFLFLIPLFLYPLLGQTVSRYVGYATIGLAFSLASLFLWMDNLLQRFSPLRKLLDFFTFSVCFLVLAAYLGYALTAGAPLGASSMLAVLQTNPAEATSYLHDMVPWAAYLLIPVLATGLGMFFFAYHPLPIRGGQLSF